MQMRILGLHHTILNLFAGSGFIGPTATQTVSVVETFILIMQMDHLRQEESILTVDMRIGTPMMGLADLTFYHLPLG
ncbi:MAG TPA: hypothetical protein DCQ92_06310 [Verrucomicrobia subdivision 3 bacterium]|nr:hypothetical protein [Limisphaerales bacterium]